MRYIHLLFIHLFIFIFLQKTKNYAALKAKLSHTQYPSHCNFWHSREHWTIPDPSPDEPSRQTSPDSLSAWWLAARLKHPRVSESSSKCFANPQRNLIALLWNIKHSLPNWCSNKIFKQNLTQTFWTWVFTAKFPLYETTFNFSKNTEYFYTFSYKRRLF